MNDFQISKINDLTMFDYEISAEDRASMQCSKVFYVIVIGIFTFSILQLLYLCF